MSSSHLFLLLSPPGCAETVGSALEFPFRNDSQEDFPQIIVHLGITFIDL